jgi:hypothetical protein
VGALRIGVLRILSETEKPHDTCFTMAPPPPTTLPGGLDVIGSPAREKEFFAWLVPWLGSVRPWRSDLRAAEIGTKFNSQDTKTVAPG